jgi:predicted nucleic-acid-binding protein
MRAADTNILVRLLTGDGGAQVAAAEQFVESGAWVSHLALAETLWVLDSYYDRSADQIIQAVERLLDHERLTLQDRDVVAAALGVFKNCRGVSFSDCLMLEIARKAGHLPLGTFDRALGKLDGAQRL